MHIGLETDPDPHLELERQSWRDIPDVRLSQDKRWLMWKLPDPVTARPSGDMKGALRAILGVRRRNGESTASVAGRVLKIAERFGPLRLQAHGYPHADLNSTDDAFYESFLGDFEKGSEPVSDWLSFAEELGDLITFASDLSLAKNFGAVADHPVGRRVVELYGGLSRNLTAGGVVVSGDSAERASGGYSIPVTLKYAIQYVELRVDDLVDQSKLRPAIQWNEGKRRFEFGFEPGQAGLFGSAVLQFALEIGGANRWLKCDTCQMVYKRSLKRRMPGRSNLNFCDKCSIDDGRKRTAQRNRRKQDGLSTK